VSWGWCHTCTLPWRTLLLRCRQLPVTQPCRGPSMYQLKRLVDCKRTPRCRLHQAQAAGGAHVKQARRARSSSLRCVGVLSCAPKTVLGVMPSELAARGGAAPMPAVAGHPMHACRYSRVWPWCALLHSRLVH
jgi:hypothetical protein